MNIHDPFKSNKFSRDKKTIIHVRTDNLNEMHAPFIPQTIYGLAPYYQNVVLATDFSVEQEDSIIKLKVDKRKLQKSEWAENFAMELSAEFENIIAVVGHFGNGMRSGYPLANALGVPILGIFGGSDVNVEACGDKYKHDFQILYNDKHTYFLTVASYLADKLIQLGAPRDRTFEWRRGVDLAQFDAPSWKVRVNNKPIKVIMAGRFLEVKGHEFAIKGFSHALNKCPDLELNFYGEGPLEGEMKSLALELDIQDKVKFHGIVPRSILLEKLKEAQIALLTSVKCRDGRSEGIPNVLIEAQAMMMPVIATSNGGISDAVSDGETGVLVDERDINGISNALVRLGLNAELRQKMGNAARKHVEQYFDREKQARILAAKLGHMSSRHFLVSKRDCFRSDLLTKNDNSNDVRDYSAILRNPVWKFGTKKFGVVFKFVFNLYVKLLSYTLFFPFKKSRSGIYLKKLTNHLPVVLSDIRYKIFHVNKGLSKTNLEIIELKQKIVRLERELMIASNSNMQKSSERHVQTMQVAQCPYCPHASLDSAWPDESCPMDVYCLNALEKEFGDQKQHRVNMLHDYKYSGELSSDTALFDDGNLCNGLEDSDAANSKNYIRYEGTFQNVDNYRELFAVASRMLKIGGLFEIVIWPLHQGSDGAKLYGSLETPFAHIIFDSSVIKEYLGDSISLCKDINIKDIESELSNYGFELQSTWVPDVESNPCPIEFQARFSSKFSSLDKNVNDLVRAYGSVWKLNSKLD